MPIDKMLETASAIGLIVMWVITYNVFFKLPNMIPIHFNGFGKADNYGDRFTLLLLPIMATVLYLSITYLNKFPHIFNYGVTITEANVEKQYRLAMRMLRFAKLSILIIFTIIIAEVYFTVKGSIDGLGWWFLPFTLALFIVPTFWMIFLSYSKKNR